jgi:diguanylate cyclase (GGDEF)-like protein
MLDDHTEDIMALMKKLEVPDFLAMVDKKLGPGMALAMVAADLDNFGGLNNLHGHEAGDQALASWERTLTGSLPKEAIVGRLGGDEYAVALPDHSAEMALIVFDEIRTHYTEHPFAPNLHPALGVSAGVAARPPHATDTADLLRAADQALARAKREGRSRVAIYVEEKMTLKSNYYARATLDRLAKLSTKTGRTEASLLREALDDLLAKHRDEL